MNPEKEIRCIEFTIKKIFQQNKINRYDVNIANKLFDKWKVLTGYVSDKTPVLKYTPDFIEPILDKEPNYKTKK